MSGRFRRPRGFSHIRARPRASWPGRRNHPGFRKNFGNALKTGLQDAAADPPTEIRFQDEARIGRKNGIVRQQARRRPPPGRPADRCHADAAVFGTIGPAPGKAAALALPQADTRAMQMHPEEISRQVARGAHAVLLPDRAGRQTTTRLNPPSDITPVCLPSPAPEPDPQEDIRQYMRANRLSNRVSGTCEEIIEATCKARTKRVALPDTITSTGMRDRAHPGRSQ